MTIYKLAPLLLIMLAGCGQDPVKKFWIEPALQSYYDSFIGEANLRGQLWDVDNLEVRFVEELGMINETARRLGTCHYDEDGTPVVEIDRGDFYGLDSRSREALLYHEFGHCLLGRGHDDSTTTNGAGDTIPTSIMQSVLLSEDTYADNKGYYIEELF